MPEEEKPSRPKLIVPGTEGGEKKSRAVVTSDGESSKPQVLLPQSEPAQGSRLVVAVPGDKETGSLPEETPAQPQAPGEQGDDGGVASAKVQVRPMANPAPVEVDQVEEAIEAGEHVEELVEVGPPPEEDAIADIVGAIGVSEEVIAGLDEEAEREERARIAEEERVRAIQEANARAEEEQRAREEEQRAREEEEARAASQARENEQPPPFGQVVQAQGGYPQQGHPASYPGYPYPSPAQGAAGEGVQGAGAVQLKPPSGIPGWALYLIGFLSGALILLILFMATPMGEGLISKSLVGKGWRAPVKRVVPPAGSQRSGSGGQPRTFSPPVQAD